MFGHLRGAGISGMLTAIRFPQKLKNIDLVVYEKNNDIRRDGTLYGNRLV
jgi:2-polyprenyl-6-methoxyphenol hydroxylase-like FAD-dependent oxidoreductase